MSAVDVGYATPAPDLEHPRRGIWRPWLWANGVGLAAGGVAFVLVAIVVAVSGLDHDDGGRQPVFGLVLGASIGAALGVAQAQALNGRIRAPRAWGVATALGLAAGSTIVFGALDHSSGLSNAAQTALHPLALAFATGVPQAWVLRGEIERSWRWVIVAVIAWGLGAVVGLGIPIDGLSLIAITVTALAIQGAALALLAPVAAAFAAPADT